VSDKKGVGLHKKLISLYNIHVKIRVCYSK